MRLTDWMTQACVGRTELEAYVRRGHKSVGGWLLDLAIAGTLLVDSVQRECGVRGAMAEIGVFQGRLLLLLHMLSRESEVTVGYDLFELMSSQDQRMYGAYDPRYLNQNLAAYAKARDRIKLLAANSSELAPARIVTDAAGPIRIFSVDGGHDADMAECDLRLAAATLADGGVVLLDDFFNVQWCGVAEAAIRYLIAPDPRLVPFMVAGNKLFLTNSVEWAAHYRNAVNQEFELSHVARYETMLAGHPVVSVWERAPPRAVALAERILSDGMINGLRRLKASLSYRQRAS